MQEDTIHTDGFQRTVSWERGYERGYEDGHRCAETQTWVSFCWGMFAGIVGLLGLGYCWGW